MSLRARLALTLAVLLAGVAVSGVVVAQRLHELSANGATVSQRVQPAVAASNAVTLTILDVEITASRFALSGSSADQAGVAKANSATVAALNVLQLKSSSDPATKAAAITTDTAYRRWFDDVIAPSVSAVAAKNAPLARTEATNPEAIAATEDLRASLVTLQKAVLDWRSNAVASTSESLTVLKGALATSLLIVLLVVAALWLGLRRWVTEPLASLAADLRRVTDGDLEHQIAAVGPPDVAATSRDAEDMRQHLLREIDEAVAAREALDQRGPVVAALRRELRASTSSQIPGLETAGLLVPAEGVLAGDWFASLVLTDGRLAVLMVDVSGHGPLAGLTALKLKYAMTASLEAGGGPRSAIEAGAAVLANEIEQFATAVVLTVTSAGDVTWCNAGHPAPTVLGRRSTSERLGTTGPLLSGLGGTWTLGKARMATDATLLVVSDGLLESRDADGVQITEAWTDEDLASLVREASTTRAAIESIAAAARARADEWRVDDLTIVAIHRSDA